MTKLQLVLPLSLAALLAACPPSKTGPTACTGTSVTCNGSCVELTSDPKNCGSCGSQCPAGQSCAASACACPGGQAACGALCSDTQTDALNCGACGKACLSGELCQGSQCVCETGRTACAGRCVDLTSDVGNCGACGTTCGSGQVCSASSCTSYCAGADGGAPDGGGIVDCGGSCVDTNTDPTNCGGCGQGCLPGSLCSGGACACGSGETSCGDAGCFNLTQDQQNCGACGTVCASYQVCQASACAGPDLYVSCSDYLFTTTTSNSIVGLNSVSGAIQLPAQPVSGPAPDGGAVVAAEIGWTLFTDPQTLWVLDIANSQIDVLDVSKWPATVKGSVGVGSAPSQLLLCGGVVVVTNSYENTVQGIDPTSMKTVAEVALSASESPTLMACDGAHTVYLTDWEGGDVKSIDVSQTTWSVAHTLVVPVADTVPLADGGEDFPGPNGIVYATTDAGGEVLVSVENLNYWDQETTPNGPSTVLVIDPQLQGVQGTIDPGNGCEDGQFLTLAPSGSLLVETCTGSYFASTGTGVVAPISLPAGTVGPLVTLPLANPGATTFLKNGLVAVGDEASGTVAIWNPADGGVTTVLACPALPDGGQVPTEVIGSAAGAP